MRSEAGEQEALFEWAEHQMKATPELRWMHHIPNGGFRNKAEAARLKRQGVKAGVADIFLPVPRGDRHGLYIEMKVGDNKPSKLQAEFLRFVEGQGFEVSVCYSTEQAICSIMSYLEERR